MNSIKKDEIREIHKSVTHPCFKQNMILQRHMEAS